MGSRQIVDLLGDKLNKCLSFLLNIFAKLFSKVTFDLKMSTWVEGHSENVSSSTFRLGKFTEYIRFFTSEPDLDRMTLK